MATRRAASDLERTPLYSEELGIDLAKGSDAEYFKWFLASVLFGARIGETIAKNTYRAFERHHVLSPRAIRRAGWDYLVNPIMREGGYVRYDGRKSTQVLRDCDELIREYGGSLRELRDRAADSDDLERRLLALYGVGPVTANIFLRELAPYWKKAAPAPLPAVARLARRLGIDLDAYPPNSTARARVESGLVRMLHRSRPFSRAQKRPSRSPLRRGAHRGRVADLDGNPERLHRPGPTRPVVSGQPK